jgi:hypothetical protein
VLGIAVMGAVLQNRAVAYIQAGVAEKLDGAPFALPAAAKQQIIDAIGASAVNMGELRAGGGVGGRMPDGVTEMLNQVPASVADQVTAFFRDLFSLDFIMGEFVRAMRTTYGFSIILMVIGAALALAVSGRIRKKRGSGAE